MGRRGDPPHLLYLAFWYPPARASGVYRALATSEAFLRDGWNVTVLTTTREFLEDEIGSVDPSLEELIPADTHVARVPFTFWDRHRDLRSVGWLQGNFPRLSRRPSDAFPDKYSGWIGPVTTGASRIAEDRPFDHVLATGNPYSSFEAARIIASESGISFSVDFRDPWSFDVFTGRRNASKSVIRSESRIVQGATACFHVNPAIANAYVAAHPESAHKQRIAANGFDPTSLGPPREPGSKGALRFGILGTLTERWPLQPTFRGWGQARHELPEGSELVIGGHLGYFPQSEQLLRSLLPARGSGVTYSGPVPKTELPSFYGSLDVVVVPVSGGAMVTSGKIYEALALGIPLVCIQERGGGARQLLDQHPFAFASDPDPDSVAAALLEAAKACEGMTLGDVKQIRTAMKKYERSQAVQPIVDVIESTL